MRTETETEEEEDELQHLTAVYADLRNSTEEIAALVESTVADSAKMAPTLLQHYLQLIDNYLAEKKKSEEATEKHREAINKLMGELRDIQRQSYCSTPDELDTHGIRFSEHNIIDQPHIEQRLYDTLSIALPSLSQRKEVTSIAQASASIVAQYIVDYLTTLRSTNIPTLTAENLDFCTTRAENLTAITQWLCETTNINADITNINADITNINADINKKISIADLNEDQARRINKLCQAFIRGKMPSLKLNLDKDQTAQQNLQADYQRDIGAALSSAIESEKPTFRHPFESTFYKKMKGLPNIIKTQPIELKEKLTEGHDATRNKIAQVISSYVILYIEYVTDNSQFSSNIDKTKLARDLALIRIDTEEQLKQHDIKEEKGGLKKIQIQHLLKVLNCITPVQSLKRFNKVSDFAIEIQNILNMKFLNKNILSKRTIEIFSSLPEAITQIISPKQSTYSGTTNVIPPDFLTLLQPKPDGAQVKPKHTPERTDIIDWIANQILSLTDETHKQASLDLFKEKHWLTDIQIQAIQTKHPAFNPATNGQMTQREINQLLKYLEEPGTTPCPKEIKKSIQAITNLDPNLGATLGQCNIDIEGTHQTKEDAENKHSEAEEKLDEFHKLFRQWIQLAIAGTNTYLANNTNTIFTGGRGRTRAKSLLAGLQNMEKNSNGENFNEGSFNALKELFKESLTTFSNGSLGTYILEAISEEKILEEENNTHDPQESEEPQHPQEIQFATKKECDKRLDTENGNIRFNINQGPTGKTGNREAIRNSKLSRRLFKCQTSSFDTRQGRANTIYSHLDKLDTRYKGMRGQ